MEAQKQKNQSSLKLKEFDFQELQCLQYRCRSHHHPSLLLQDLLWVEQQHDFNLKLLLFECRGCLPLLGQTLLRILSFRRKLRLSYLPAFFELKILAQHVVLLLHAGWSLAIIHGKTLHHLSGLVAKAARLCSLRGVSQFHRRFKCNRTRLIASSPTQYTPPYPSSCGPLLSCTREAVIQLQLEFLLVLPRLL